MIRLLTAFCLLFATTGGVAGEITGKVIAVADGDTITVLIGHREIKVRLTEIDAPEKKQAFWSRSKQSLSDLCFGKTATLAEHGKDRYGRTLARVTCAGTDANAVQVRRGMAWVYDRYVTDHSLYSVQADAKAARRGLWKDDQPVPPWEWRRIKRNTQSNLFEGGEFRVSGFSPI